MPNMFVCSNTAQVEMQIISSVWRHKGNNSHFKTGFMALTEICWSQKDTMSLSEEPLGFQG